jgi:hypothetical protein
MGARYARDAVGPPINARKEASKLLARTGRKVSPRYCAKIRLSFIVSSPLIDVSTNVKNTVIKDNNKVVSNCFKFLNRYDLETSTPIRFEEIINKFKINTGSTNETGLLANLLTRPASKFRNIVKIATRKAMEVILLFKILNMYMSFSKYITNMVTNDHNIIGTM